MHCATVFYPNQDGAHFDFGYYLEKHMPMAGARFGDNVIKTEIRKGVGMADGGRPIYLCVLNIWIHSAERLRQALADHRAQILGDVPNYTNVTPVIEFEETVCG